MKALLRTFLWYLAAVYFFGPLLLAPFTGGSSLAAYIFPFTFFIDHTLWLSSMMQLAFIVPAAFFTIFHYFVRYSLRRAAVRHAPRLRYY